MVATPLKTGTWLASADSAGSKKTNHIRPEALKGCNSTYTLLGSRLSLHLSVVMQEPLSKAEIPGTRLPRHGGRHVAPRCLGSLLSSLGFCRVVLLLGFLDMSMVRV